SAVCLGIGILVGRNAAMRSARLAAGGGDEANHSSQPQPPAERARATDSPADSPVRDANPALHSSRQAPRPPPPNPHEAASNKKPLPAEEKTADGATSPSTMKESAPPPAATVKPSSAVSSPAATVSGSAPGSHAASPQGAGDAGPSTQPPADRLVPAYL